MTELREAHRRGQSRSDGSNITVGDIVLVNDPDHKRTFWKQAKVKKLIKSSDGQVRGARIQVGVTGSILRRPVQALYPLEICASQPAQSMVNEPTRDDPDEPTRGAPDEHIRPTRKAAQNAQQLWRERLCVD